MQTHGPQKGLCSHACVPRNKRRAIHNWENPSNLPPCGVTCATHPGPRSTRDIRVHRGVGVNIQCEHGFGESGISASAVPVLTVGAEGRVVECVEVHSKTPTPSFFFVPLSHVFGNQTQFLVFVPLSSCTEPQETGWLGLRRGF